MNNYQQFSDWTIRLQQLRQIQHDVAQTGFLAKAIAETDIFLSAFQYDSLGSRLEEIKTNYMLMCDFLKKGFRDDSRQKLYDSLQAKLYDLLHDIELDYRRVNDPLFGRHLSVKTTTDPDVGEIRQRLENFVSDVAVASLDAEEVRQIKESNLYEAHHQYLQSLFNSMLLSHLWMHEVGQDMARTLSALTIDSKDACLLISAIMLGGMLSGDAERLLALLYIYEHAQDEHVRQRALVGWVLILGRLNMAMYPQVRAQIRTLLSSETVRQELHELQIQMVFCRNAKRDNEKLQKEIIPTLLRNHSFEIDESAIREIEDSLPDDILHPDAAERKMEEMEESVRKIMDMREQGVDVFFGGFSQMKRFSFFYTLPNWFMPFSPNHPQLQHLSQDLLHSKMMQAILQNGTFCDSDKYSFVLGIGNMFHKLPDNIKEMLNTSNGIVIGMDEDPTKSNTPSYIRMAYLQDLYRFFSLCDAHHIFENPFEETNFLFLSHNVFRGQMGDEARKVQKFFLKRKMYSSLSQLFYAYKEYDNIEDRHMEAAIMMRERKYMQAQAIYERLLDDNPNDERAMRGCAQAAFCEEDYEEAAKLYERLHEQLPDNSGVALNLAIAQINSDNAESGMKILFKLDYETPGNINVKRAMAWGYLWMIRPEQADKLYQEILDNKACNASDYLNAGYANWFQGRVDTAIAIIRQSVAASDNIIKDAVDLMRQFDKDTALINKFSIGEAEQKMVAELVMLKMV